jgi:4-hydroxybenzoate polyprenyltransferase
VAIASGISVRFLIFLLCYALIAGAYTAGLKSVAVVDLFCIAGGFLLRLEAGGEVFNIVVSQWLFLSVFLLAIFLSTGKRLCEVRMMGEQAGKHRQILTSYPKGFLDGTIYMTGGAVLVTYSMYCLTKPRLVYTVPLCMFGLMRYIFRAQSGEGGDPTESLLKDPVLFAVGALWALMVTWSIYL